MRQRRETPNSGDPDVHVITTAVIPLSVDQAARSRRYLYAMSIRTACVLAAIVIPGWPRWALIAAAVILPYLAVVIANAGRENNDPPTTSSVPPPESHPTLPTGKTIKY